MIAPFYQIIDDAAWLQRFLPLGLKTVQLRLKDKPRDVVHTQIAAAKTLCDAAGATLIINDYWREALDAGVSYVYLGQEDLDTADVQALKAANVRLGISTHNDAELERALALQPDYVALGPIYPTILKAMHWAPQGLEKITVWKQRIGNIPLVTIGGFTPERAPAAYAAGADSVCVVTDVLLNQSPEDRLKQWLDIYH